MEHTRKYKPTDKQLAQAIDLIFAKFDTNKDGKLDRKEVFVMLSQSIRKKGTQTKITAAQVE